MNRAKSNLLLTIVNLLLIVANLSRAADNEAAAPKFQYQGNQVRVRDTDASGIHTPHMIVDGTQRTVSGTAATTNGTVTAGARRVTFAFSSDFAGTVMGLTFAGTDLPLVIEAPAGDTLSAVAYTVSAGTARIVQIR